MSESRDLKQPLDGLCVMVTRPTIPNDPLVERLTALGADVIEQPAIRIGPPDDWGPVDAALDRLDQFDWLVFSSANGVRYLLDRLATHKNSHRLGNVRLAAIGPGTAEELARHRLRAEVVPEQFRAEALAQSLASQAAGRRFLLARASRGREVLAEQLAAAGASVEQIVVYSSVNVTHPQPETTAMLCAGQIDWTTVTSSGIARSLADLFGDDLHLTKLASISPITTGTLIRRGFKPAVEAAEYTTAGLVSAIVSAVASR